MQIDINNLSRLPSIDILARQLVEGFITGLHKSPYHGFSVEFAEHQLYNPGDSTRHIDWKVFSRTDRLYTKRYEEETNLRAYLVVDQSSSMFYPSDNHGKIRFSAVAAAALAYLLYRQRDAVGLVCFDEAIERITPVKSTEVHLQHILRHLNDLLREKPLHKKTDVSRAIHEIAEKIHNRSLVVLFTDMFDSSDDQDAVFRALQHLKHKKHEVLLFHVTDFRTERHFEFANKPHEFIDLESGVRVKMNPYEYKMSYLEMSESFYHKIKLRCGELKIDFIEVDIMEDVEVVLGNYLIKRSKMK